jgi:hypothetical protein
MTALFAWLGSVLRGLFEDGIRPWFTKFYLGVVIGPAAASVVLLAWLNQMIGRTTNFLVNLGDLGLGATDPCGGTIASTLALANTFFPVDELLRMLFVLVVGVWLPIGGYRLAKSWTPGGFAGGS